MNQGNEKNRAGWNFDNSYSKLPEFFFTIQELNPVSSPKLVILNKPLATSLGLDVQALESEESVDVFAGNQVPDGGLPLAQAYAGHQFGHFNMLGDGRALLLGEQITPKNKRYDIQLKGSGRTPYSRGGDGRAALGPMLREYIISEAMHALGIPTTRSLAVVTTGEQIQRDTRLPGAIMTRIAASHIRVGTFQYVSRWGSVSELKELADYTIQRHYPEIDKNNPNQYFLFLQEVIKRQVSLIIKWQMVGFIHGVMNTDNMTISGETIDYGPCAFMDTYDPATVFSSIDLRSRYAYGNQPKMAGWNLARFAETLLPLLHEDQEKALEIAQNAISEYPMLYVDNWVAGMRKKLGIFNEEDQDKSLIDELLEMMEKHKSDYTNTFRALSYGKQEDMNLFTTPEFKQWEKLWQERLSRQSESMEASLQLMKDNNPTVIPRNHRVEEALKAAVENGDYSVMEKLLKVLSNPYMETNEQESYCTLPPDPDRPYQTYCGT
ncbi:protein adenylyltransferase SelO [Gottfriedia luciferensis]|uniref:protein adenylyltransferase SelO n=1 Tax=Gottfriedia luciferensis TaxID=178774 RepID=UPI000B434D38|nr:YdiU family protein [Gottfriedia luciferensis]